MDLTVCSFNYNTIQYCVVYNKYLRAYSLCLDQSPYHLIKVCTISERSDKGYESTLSRDIFCSIEDAAKASARIYQEIERVRSYRFHVISTTKKFVKVENGCRYENFNHLMSISFIQDGVFSFDRELKNLQKEIPRISAIIKNPSADGIMSLFDIDKFGRTAYYLSQAPNKTLAEFLSLIDIELKSLI